MECSFLDDVGKFFQKILRLANFCSLDQNNPPLQRVVRKQTASNQQIRPVRKTNGAKK